MTSFLQELAEEIYRLEPNPSQVTVIFPNRRAAIYFRKYLGEIISKPIFSPQVLTLEDFIAGFSELRVPDKLELVQRLHVCYKELMTPEAETFDQFFTWGDMLLRDFDETDRYLVDVRLLFSDLSHFKELDSTLDYLTEEQKNFLKNFWQGFDENSSVNKKKFIEVWHKLYPLYQLFNEKLLAEGLTYEGRLHRIVAEDLASEKIKLPDKNRIWFAGFNALTQAEEQIISLCVEKINASIRWDNDQYYMNDNRQEAGLFLNRYKLHPVLGKTILPSAPGNFQSGKNIEILSATQSIGQAKFLAHELAKHLKEGMDPEETLIILSDEKMLIPVLHSISPVVKNINVSMGFPFVSTPVYNLIELLVELQISLTKETYHFDSVQRILLHPYVNMIDAPRVQSQLRTIQKYNWISVTQNFLTDDAGKYAFIFQPAQKITEYLLNVLNKLSNFFELYDELDKEYILRGIQLINRLDAVWDNVEPNGPQRSNRLKSFLSLFRQYAKNEKIPFAGEPLKGMPVMGVLESRNLDFKNVFIVSMNEGVFPSAGRRASYIPFSIRKAYNLPTDEHQGTIYAYLFYRAIQRAQNVFLFYNSEPDVLGQGEMSRYLQQLLYESRWPIQQRVLHNIAQAHPIEPITIEKTEEVLRSIAQLNSGNSKSKGFHPSALNTFLDCRLKFYFQYIERIRELDQVQEEIDPRALGNLLHHVLENFYLKIKSKKPQGPVDVDDFSRLEEQINQLTDESLRMTYHANPDEKMTYEGQRVIVREVVKKFAVQILEQDKKYTPFSIVALEENQWSYYLKISHSPGFAIVGGTVDRVDSKQNHIRVIDYKTGKDELKFDSIESLFVPGEKRNKAVFQILLYSLLYKTNSSVVNQKIIPGLMNRKNLFDDQFNFGLMMEGQLLDDIMPLLPEFEERLKTLLENIFDPTQPFTQTDNTKICKLCTYREICYR